MENSIRDLLMKGDLRTTDRVEDVLQGIQNGIFRIQDLFPLLFDQDPGVRMRAADAFEKICREDHLRIDAFRIELLQHLPDIHQQEVIWHVASLLSYAKWNKMELELVVNHLLFWLETEHSSIVRVNCIQALFDLSLRHRELKPKMMEILEQEMHHGTASIKARCRKIVRKEK